MADVSNKGTAAGESSWPPSREKLITPSVESEIVNGKETGKAKDAKLNDAASGNSATSEVGSVGAGVIAADAGCALLGVGASSLKASPGADASMPVSWDLRKIEKAGFEIHTVENVGIHYSKTIAAWYDNWMSNKDAVIAKYGEMQFRMYQIFLGWSVRIADIGGSSAYQIICHKNINSVPRERYIGKMALGENKKFANSTSVSSDTTTDKVMEEYQTKEKKTMVK